MSWIFPNRLRSPGNKGRNSLHACSREIANIFILYRKKKERTSIGFVFRECMKFEILYMTEIHGYLHVFEAN